MMTQSLLSAETLPHFAVCAHSVNVPLGKLDPVALPFPNWTYRYIFSARENKPVLSLRSWFGRRVLVRPTTVPAFAFHG